MPHEIRLAGPWKRFDGKEWTETSLPEEFPPGTTLRRTFNCPTGLEAEQRVTVAIEASATAEVSVNESRLQSNGAVEHQEFEFGAAIQQFNTLDVNSQSPLELKEVRLRIYEADE